MSTAEKTLEALLEVIDTKTNANELVQAVELILEAYLAIKADTEAQQYRLAELTDAAQSVVDNLTKRLSSIRDGKDYVLTAKDKREIAKAINVPVVEKLVETIIREQPLVTEITNEITKEVAVAESAEQIIEKVNDPAAPLIKLERIEGLQDEIKKSAVKGGGGSMGLSVGHWPLHENFSMNGVATTVSLTVGGVGAAGNGCFVRYQGKVLDHNVDYTVSGNKITFVGFTPESGTVISVMYWQ